MTMDEDLAQIDPTVQWRWQDLIEVSMDGKPYLRKVDVASYVCYCSIGLMDRYGDQEHAMVFEDNDSNCMLLMCCGSDMVACFAGANFIPHIITVAPGMGARDLKEESSPGSDLVRKGKN